MAATRLRLAWWAIRDAARRLVGLPRIPRHYVLNANAGRLGVKMGTAGR